MRHLKPIVESDDEFAAVFIRGNAAETARGNAADAASPRHNLCGCADPANPTFDELYRLVHDNAAHFKSLIDSLAEADNANAVEIKRLGGCLLDSWFPHDHPLFARQQVPIALKDPDFCAVAAPIIQADKGIAKQLRVISTLDDPAKMVKSVVRMAERDPEKWHGQDAVRQVLQDTIKKHSEWVRPWAEIAGALFGCAIHIGKDGEGSPEKASSNNVNTSTVAKCVMEQHIEEDPTKRDLFANRTFKKAIRNQLSLVTDQQEEQSQDDFDFAKFVLTDDLVLGWLRKSMDAKEGITQSPAFRQLVADWMEEEQPSPAKKPKRMFPW
jgi:hypothetical protein